MKKIIVIALTLIIILVIGYFAYQRFSYWREMPNMTLNEIKLRKKGYDNTEINLLLNNLTDQEITLVLASNYKYLPEVISNINYQSLNLRKYLNYANHNLNLTPQLIIDLVNYGFDAVTYEPIYEAIINEPYFIKQNATRYQAYYLLNKELIAAKIVSNVNTNLDFPFYGHNLVSDTSKGILSIANKYYTLPADFNGFDLVNITGTKYQMTKEAYTAYQEMAQAASLEGLAFAPRSAYRSFSSQEKIYNGYVLQDGVALADTYSARAGHSEHQLGLTIDLKSTTMDTIYFEKTNEYTWLMDNAYQYGFIERYPLGKEYITGYQYEPWHWRYCGIDCATYIHNNKVTFDEYYAFFVNK